MISRALTGGLALLLMVSAFGVVYAQHESRKLFVQLQDVQGVRDELEVEWGRLQLEQSTWATDGRIEKTARSKLDMNLPPPEAIVIAKP